MTKISFLSYIYFLLNKKVDKELNSHPFKSFYKIWWIMTLKMHQKSSIHFVLKGYEMLLMFFKWHVIKRHIKIHISLHSLKSFEILDCMLFHVSILSSECSNKQTDCQIQSCWYTFIISHMDKTELLIGKHFPKYYAIITFQYIWLVYHRVVILSF